MKSRKFRRRAVLLAFYVFVVFVRWRDGDSGQLTFAVAFAAIVIGIELMWTRFGRAEPEVETGGN